MIKRQDIIFEKVKEMCRKALDEGKTPGMTAQEIADLLSMDRGNVSKEMNLLASSGKLIKHEGRPVRFSEKNIYEEYHTGREVVEVPEAFRGIIGLNGSLKMQIKQVKAAMLYPPHGLHTLLNGPTGTGKTLFAHRMFEYAKRMNMLKAGGEFVTFNCAEYAENPQLIVSQIFGHKKGAFTGADRDKPGLIESADGGILFLDEIHRLPPEGQEMLFSLMDYGKYRRLGETERERKADVLIIGATTENLQDVLLKTFLRRMTAVIRLPALEERPLSERLEMIELFLLKEQKNFSMRIKISREAIIGLLLYECTGNIGQLKTDIQLLCARAFWEYKAGGKDEIEVSRQMMPIYIEQGFYKAQKSKNDLLRFLMQGEENYLFPAAENQEEEKQRTISRSFESYHYFHWNNDMENGQGNIKNYISSMIENERWQVYRKEALNKEILGRVYYAAEEVIKFAEMRLKRKFSDNIKLGFALHINTIVEGLDKKRDFGEDKLKQIMEEHPAEAKIAKIILRILEDELETAFQYSEIGYITMFLCADESERERKKIGVIVIAHGESTAESISNVVNQLLETTQCRAVNMPLEEEIEEVYKRVLKTAEQADEGRGVLLLVDMGSLNMFAERIRSETNIEIESLGMVSTLLALEAVRKSIMGQDSLTEVVRHLRKMVLFMAEGNKKAKPADIGEGNKVILVTCMSGMGAAKKIAEMVRAIIGIEFSDSITVCCVGKEGLDENGEFLGGYQERDILAVAGTADIPLKTAPYISVDEIVTGAGIERLEQAVSRYHTPDTVSEKERLVVDERILVIAVREFLEFLDAEKIVSIVLSGIYGYVGYFRLNEQTGKIVRYTIHTACMVERLFKKEILPYHDIEKFTEENYAEMQMIGEILRPVEETFQIEVPETEKAYLVELLGEEDERCSTGGM